MLRRARYREASTLELVAHETRKAIAEVLGWSQVEIVNLDDLGRSVVAGRAAEQTRRLLTE
jgi:hypothetical protein